MADHRVAALIYTAFGLAHLDHHLLPWWAALPGRLIVCLHGSLQHEVAHNHPTRTAWINEALVFPSLWLWLPFRIYRESHLTHHRDERLTCPVEDPESNYMSAETWERMGPAARVFRRASAPSPGGWSWPPLLCRAAARGTRSTGWSSVTARTSSPGRSIPAPGWCSGLGGRRLRDPVEEYILLYAYPGLALTVLRSYCEHRAVPAVGERTGIVEAGPLMSLMYLNNNLHAVHHAKASLAWYRLPALYRERRTEFLAANGGYVFPGYWQIVGRYLIVPKEPTPHPFLGRPEPAKAA